MQERKKGSARSLRSTRRKTEYKYEKGAPVKKEKTREEKNKRGKKEKRVAK